MYANSHSTACAHSAGCTVLQNSLISSWESPTSRPLKLDSVSSLHATVMFFKQGSVVK